MVILKKNKKTNRNWFIQKRLQESVMSGILIACFGDLITLRWDILKFKFLPSRILGKLFLYSA